MGSSREKEQTPNAFILINCTYSILAGRLDYLTRHNLVSLNVRVLPSADYPFELCLGLVQDSKSETTSCFVAKGITPALDSLFLSQQPWLNVEVVPARPT